MEVNMFCSKCGAKNPERAKFCAKCGAELGAPVKSSEAAATPEAESSTGLSANAAGFLCYVAVWITGIVFILLEKKNTFVKFHAWQSIITFVALTVAQVVLLILAAIPSPVPMLWSPKGVLIALSVIVWFIIVGLWIALMILAYQGKMWKVPWAGDWAEKQISK
jgi:uncharacterized membrane protein